MIIRDDLIIDNFEILFEKKIILYGAGEYGKKAFDIITNILGVEIYCFCETDKERWIRGSRTSTYQGIAVKGLSEIKDELLNSEIIISTDLEKCEQICCELQRVCPELQRVFSWYGLWYCVCLNIKDKRISNLYRNRHYILTEMERKTNRMRYLMGMTYDLLSDNPILVYQAGKVGSSSVYKSIKEHKKNALHIHNIANFGVRKGDENNNEIKSAILMWKNNNLGNKKIKVISIVRDPIARSISLYFEGFRDTYIEDANILCKYDDNRIKSDTVEGVRKIIEDHKNYGKYGEMFEWYNDELKKVFGIDIYNYPFDRKKGYGIISEGNVEVLLLTIEKLVQNNNIIASFVGVDGFTISNANVGLSKTYKHIYKNIIDKIKIDNEVLDFYYKSNKYMNHFYNDEQKNVFREHWS